MPPPSSADQDGAHAAGTLEIGIYRPYPQEPLDKPTPERSAAGSHLSPPDLLDELITLAHEYGHAVSFLGETPRSEWLAFRTSLDRFNAATNDAINAINAINADSTIDVVGVDRFRLIVRRVRDALAEQDRELILREEELAWRVGRRALSELGFDQWAIYDQREARGLHNQRCRFGTEELDDEDIAAAASSRSE